MNYKLIRNKWVTNYLNEHPCIYSELEINYLLDILNQPYEEECTEDYINEIYDELGLLKDENNIYVGFIDLLEQDFNYKDRNIIEIGGGVIPRLGKRISKNLEKGKITVYDERISPYEKNTDKLKLIRKRFDKNTPLDKTNLLIGLMPCEAAEILIDTATKNNIDFILGLCEGGPHGDYFDYYESEDEWIQSMICFATRKVENNNMGKLKIKSLTKYNDPYPVIYNER